MTRNKITTSWVVAGAGAAVLAVAGLTQSSWLKSQPQALVSGTAADTAAEKSAAEPAPAATAQAPAPAAPATQQVASAAPPKQVETATPAVKPTFDTVRVEKSGEAVIAGRAEPGAQVTVKLGDQIIGMATAGSDGSFVLVPDKPLPPGTGALSLEETPKGGIAPVKSDQLVAVIVPARDQPATATVAVISPDQPTKVLQKPAETVVAETQVAGKPVANGGLSLDAVDYDQAGNIVFSGQFAAGATARVYVDNKLAGEAKAGDDRHWSFAGTDQIGSGVHALRVDGLDGTGAVIARVEAPFFRETAQKVASAATTASDATSAAQPAAAAPAQPAPAAPAQAETQPATQVAAAPSTEVPKPKDGRVVIQPGNNLWRMATVIYGSGTKYTVLYSANKDLIRNPNLIYPGQIFKTPDAVPPEQIDPNQKQPLQPGDASAQ